MIQKILTTRKNIFVITPITTTALNVYATFFLFPTHSKISIKCLITSITNYRHPSFSANYWISDIKGTQYTAGESRVVPVAGN